MLRIVVLCVLALGCRSITGNEKRTEEQLAKQTLGPGLGNPVFGRPPIGILSSWLKHIKPSFDFLSEFSISITQETRSGTQYRLDVFWTFVFCELQRCGHLENNEFVFSKKNLQISVNSQQQKLAANSNDEFMWNKKW